MRNLKYMKEAMDKDYSLPWEEELKKVKQCSQRQDSTTDQLKDLIIIANRFGFYDAADYLKMKLEIK